MSMRDQVIDLAEAGDPPARIEAKTGLRRGTIYAYLSVARAAGRDIPRFSVSGIAATDGTRLVVPGTTTETLRPYARARGLSVAALARELLAGIARDRLVCAVLDDEEGGDD